MHQPHRCQHLHTSYAHWNCTVASLRRYLSRNAVAGKNTFDGSLKESSLTALMSPQVTNTPFFPCRNTLPGGYLYGASMNQFLNFRMNSLLSNFILGPLMALLRLQTRLTGSFKSMCFSEMIGAFETYRDVCGFPGRNYWSFNNTLGRLSAAFSDSISSISRQSLSCGRGRLVWQRIFPASNFLSEISIKETPDCVSPLAIVWKIGAPPRYFGSSDG